MAKGQGKADRLRRLVSRAVKGLQNLRLAYKGWFTLTRAGLRLQALTKGGWLTLTKGGLHLQRPAYKIRVWKGAHILRPSLQGGSGRLRHVGTTLDFFYADKVGFPLR